MIDKKHINVFILIVLMALWFMPMFQHRYSFFKVEALGGVTNSIIKDTSLTKDLWFSGEYGDIKTNYINANFGYREIAIKLQNQLQYWLFDKTNAEDIILGKNNYLFELKYIRSYFGVDYMGENYLKDKLHKMQFIQDTLAKLNKTFIFLIAPSKARFLPEYIPDKYRTDSVNTNYTKLKELLKNYHVNYIDYQAMFNRLKPTSKHQLYPYAGTHWSEYGNVLALDSLKHYIETKTRFVLPEFNYSKIKITDGYGGTDNDMGKAINLLFPPNYGNLSYPEVVIKETQNTKKPSLLMIADSYWFSIYQSKRPNKLFKSHSFWYYYDVSYDYNNGTENKSPIDLNFEEEINKNDVICVMCTEPNLKAIGYRFIEDCYDYFKNGKLDYATRKRNLEISKKRLYFWSDKNSFEKMIINAKSEHKSIDSVIINLAKYMVDSGH